MCVGGGGGGGRWAGADDYQTFSSLNNVHNIFIFGGHMITLLICLKGRCPGMPVFMGGQISGGAEGDGVQLSLHCYCYSSTKTVVVVKVISE